MRKKREEPKEWPTALIRAVSPNRRLLRRVNAQPRSPSPDYFVYSNETHDTVWIDPDSPEWFHWLEELTSFDFDGKDGDFLAYKQSPKRSGESTHWIACQQWGEKEEVSLR